MDPFSLTLGVIAVIQVTSQTATQLYTFVDTVRNAPDEVGALSREAHSFYGVLRGLAVALQNPNVKEYVRRNTELRDHLQSLEEPIKTCNRRLSELMVKLDRMTERNADGSRSVKSLKWYMDKGDVLTARSYLADTTQTVNLALSSINLLESLRHNAGEGAASLDKVEDAPKAPRLDLNAQLQDLQKQGSELRRAARDGDNRAIELLLSAGVPVDSKSYESRTALSHAAQHGNIETVRLLLARGAYVNTQAAILKGDYYKEAESKRTPLHWAATGGHLKVAEVLLDAGAQIETKTNNQRTPAQEAAISDHLKTVAFLLERGADVNSRTYFGWTMLHTAASNGKLELANLLLEKGADVEAVYKGTWRGEGKGEIRATNQRPLHHAARPNHKPASHETAVLELLMQKGKASTISQDSNGATPLHYAIRARWTAAVEAILTHTVEPVLEVKDAAGVTPRQAMIDSGDPKLRRLVESSSSASLDERTTAGAVADQSSFS